MERVTQRETHGHSTWAGSTHERSSSFGPTSIVSLSRCSQRVDGRRRMIAAMKRKAPTKRIRLSIRNRPAMIHLHFQFDSATNFRVATRFKSQILVRQRFQKSATYSSSWRKQFKPPMTNKINNTLLFQDNMLLQRSTYSITSTWEAFEMARTSPNHHRD